MQTVMVQKPIRRWIDIAAQGPRTISWQFGGQPAPLPVGSLPVAQSFEEEVLHVYHYLAAGRHPNGWVARATAAQGGGPGLDYAVDLSGEPSGIPGYVHLHLDTSVESQTFAFGLEGDRNREVEAEVRVRQYAQEGSEEYTDAVRWTRVQGGGVAQLIVPVDKWAVAAGGRTVVEWRFSTRDGRNFGSNVAISIRSPWWERTQWVAENRAVTTCEERDEYRFGFNGKEKDNEAKGLGNSLDFGARIYDSRLGRWLSLDPKATKYPGHSPYNFSLNSPIMNRDPDGRDVEVAIARNPQGDGGTIAFSSTVYVTGPAAASIVEASNKSFGEWKNKGGTTTDGKWQVQVQMTFKVATAADVERIKSAGAEQAGENLLNANLPAGGRAFAGIQGENYRNSREGKFHGSGNQARIAPSDGGRTAIHESLHLFGLGDRYTDVSYEMTIGGESKGCTSVMSTDHVGFKGDIMNSGLNFNQAHVDNLASEALQLSTDRGDNFVMGRVVDDAGAGGTATSVDQVPQTFKSGNVEYSNPQSPATKR